MSHVLVLHTIMPIGYIFFLLSTNPCDMYTSSLRHIHDPVLLSQDGNYTCINFFINSIDIGIGHTRSTKTYKAILY